MKKIMFFITLITNFVFVTNAVAQLNNYDLGARHNQMVEYINSYDFTGKDENAFMDDLIYTTGKMFDDKAFPEGKSGIWGVIQLCGKADPGLLDRAKTFESATSLLEQKGQISTASNIFLNSLVSQTESVPDYKAFVSKIEELEKGYNTAALPDNEKLIVTGLISIFKSSASYWNNYFNPEEITPEPQGRFNLKCFFCVAKRDLLGAAVGFLIGNCICKKLGIPDPAICGTIGAVGIGALYSWAAKVCPGVCEKCKKPSAGSYPSWLCRLPFL